MEELKLTLLLPSRMNKLYADWNGEIAENVLWDRDEKNLESNKSHKSWIPQELGFISIIEM